MKEMRQEILEKQKEIYLRTMEELFYTWNENLEELQKLHNRRIGIRSSQVGALVILLIKKGILK